MQSYYDLLDVTPRASLEEIKASYRKLAKACHPDLNANDPLATRRFTRLSKAYQVLTNPELRGIYDAHLRRRLRTKREPWSTISRGAMMAGFGCATAAGAIFFVIMGIWGPAATASRMAAAEAQGAVAVVQAPDAAGAMQLPNDTPVVNLLQLEQARSQGEPASATPPGGEQTAKDQVQPVPAPKNRRASSRRAGSSG